MLEKVFRKAVPADGKRGGRLVRGLGIVSMAMWAVALGAFLALKADLVPPAVMALLGKAAPSAPGNAHDTPAAAGEHQAHEPSPAASLAEHASPPGGDAPAAAGIPAAEERQALRELAGIHHARGDLAKALAPVQRLLLAERDLPLLAMATEIFLGLGHYREAREAAEQALRLAPRRNDLEVSAVTALYRMGKVEEAMAESKESLKRHPANPELLVALGTMEIEMGQAWPDYGKSLEAALKLKPDFVPALYLAGRKAQLEGNYHDAEIAFRKVVKHDPRHAKAHGQLGMALYHLRKERAAEAQYRKALALNPRDYNTWFNLGEVHLSWAARASKAGDVAAYRRHAMMSYLKAVELNADHAEAHFRIGVLLNGNAQFKEAIGHLETAAKLDGRHVPTLLQLAVAYESLKQPERARAWLQKAKELDPLDKVVLLKLKRLS